MFNIVVELSSLYPTTPFLITVISDHVLVECEWQKHVKDLAFNKTKSDSGIVWRINSIKIRWFDGSYQIIRSYELSQLTQLQFKNYTHCNLSAMPKILKTKIAKANMFSSRRTLTPTSKGKATSVDKIHRHIQLRVTEEANKKYHEVLKLKNVYKNFTRSICSFIVSDASTPYLLPIAKELSFEEKEFKEYIRARKEDVKGIVELRGLLTIQVQDTAQVISFKKGFQRLAEVFIKYFAANWICCSKLEYKLDYLKFRHRFLKKIRNPSFLRYPL